MPKNDKDELNINNAEQAPASYTPPADTAAEETEATPIESARSKRRLGTGAIIGISAAGVVLLAGVFGGGYALAHTMEENSRPAMGTHSDFAGEMGDMDGDGDGPHMPGDQAQPGQMKQRHGQMPEGDQDGPMPGNVPHQHDANGQDIVPEGTTTPAPSATTTN